MSKYSTVNEAGFQAYHGTRGNEIPGTATSEDIDAALLVASEWIDNKYGSAFVGMKKDGFLQEREWPRTNATVYVNGQSYTYPDTDIPERINKAVYEAAYKQLLAPGSALNFDFTPGKYKRVSVAGAISVDYAGFTSASQAAPQYQIIDDLLSPLLDTQGQFSSYSGRVERV